MGKKIVHRESIRYPCMNKEKKTWNSYKIDPCNKAGQSLCISTKETPLERPFAMFFYYTHAFVNLFYSVFNHFCLNLQWHWYFCGPSSSVHSICRGFGKGFADYVTSSSKTCSRFICQDNILLASPICGWQCKKRCSVEGSCLHSCVMAYFVMWYFFLL